MQAQEQQERLNNLINEYSDLFNTYDFYVSHNVPKDAYKAIDIGAGMYIVFTHKDIKSTMEEKMKEYIEEQNEKIKKGEKPFDNIE